MAINLIWKQLQKRFIKSWVAMRKLTNKARPVSQATDYCLQFCLLRISLIVQFVSTKSKLQIAV